MQSGLENLPYFVQPNYGVPLMIQPQGINIVLTPSITYNTVNSENINANDNFEVTEAGHDEDDDDDDEQEEVENEDSTNTLSDEEIECYKQKIYNHPLFALISFLFERCDQSTSSPMVHPIKNIDNDINNHFIKLHQEETPIFTEDSEVDSLMIEALKVFKIHLIELEKVHDLCKDFCTRYIRCLKTSMHSSQLVPIDPEDDNDTSLDISNVDGSIVSPLKSPILSTNIISPISNLSQGQVVSGGTVYQMVQTPQGLVAQPIQIPAQVMENHSPPQVRAMQDPQLVVSGGLLNYPQQSLNTQLFAGHEEDDNHRKKSKRGVLPKKATKVMKAWLFQHLSHPYPNEDEKRQIASQTNLTILQVNNWFINGRRRILQPMMNTSSELSKQKSKRYHKKSSTQRFWPPASSNEHEGGEDDDDDNDDETDDEVDGDRAGDQPNGDDVNLNTPVTTMETSTTQGTADTNTSILTFRLHDSSNNKSSTTLNTNNSLPQES